MEYVLIEWLSEDLDVDDPVRVYRELDENRREVRRIEVYKNGLTYACGGEFGQQEALSPHPFPENIRSLSLPGERLAGTISPAAFREMWGQVQENPDGFMGMFF